jgi:hypothetical protein
MGAAITKNTAAMTADVYNSATSTTNVMNTNTNQTAQMRVIDKCNIFSEGGAIDLSETGTQVLNVTQYTNNRNAQQAQNLINQKLLQAAQSTVSDYGIGVAAAINNMSMATNVSTSMQQAINDSNANINNQMQSWDCDNSDVDSGGGPINAAMNSNQSLLASQATYNTQLQSITNSVSQSAQQTAQAAVTGFSLGSILMVIAGVILLIILAKVFASKANGGGNGSEAAEGEAAAKELSGGEGAMIAGLPLGLWIFYIILMVILSVMGGIGLNERSKYRCNFDSQCNYVQPLLATLTTGGQCSCSDHLACALRPDWSHSMVTAPPLFMANPVQSSEGFGAGTSTTLSPGSLQYMAMMASASYAAGMPDGNNAGYNLGIFNRLLNIVDPAVDPEPGNADPIGTAKKALFGAALADYIFRQMQSPTSGTSNSPRIVPPDRRPDRAHWCNARILMNLIPIQPVFAAPVDPDNLLCANAGKLSFLTKTCIPFDSSPSASNSGCEVTGPSTPPNTKGAKENAGARAGARNGRRLPRRPPRTRTMRLPRDAPPPNSQLHPLAPKTPAAPSIKSLAVGVEEAARMVGRPLDFAARLRHRLLLRSQEKRSLKQKLNGLKRKFRDGVKRGLKLGIKKSSQRSSQRKTRLPQTTATETATDDPTCSPGPFPVATGWAIWNSKGTDVPSASSPSGINVFDEVCYMTRSSEGEEATAANPMYFKPAVNGTCDSGWNKIWSANQGDQLTAKDAGSCANKAIRRKNMMRSKFQPQTKPTASQCITPATNFVEGFAKTAWNEDDPNVNRLFDGVTQGVNQCHNTGTDCVTAPGQDDPGQLGCTLQELDHSNPQAGYVTAMGLLSTQVIDPSSGPRNISQYVTTFGITKLDTQNVFYADLSSVVPADIGTETDKAASPAVSAQPSCDAKPGILGFQGNVGGWDGTTVTHDVAVGDVDNCSPLSDPSSNSGGVGQVNPYCNMIVGLCNAEDNTAPDFDASCPGYRGANYTTGDSSTLKYYDNCAQQPIQQCTLYTKTDDVELVASHKCSADHMGGCWSRNLCAAVGGSWTPESDGGGNFLGYVCSSKSVCPADSGESTGTACLSCMTDDACSATFHRAPAKGETAGAFPCQCCYDSGMQGPSGCTKASCKDTASGATCNCDWGSVPQPFNGGPQPAKPGCGHKIASHGCQWDDRTGSCLLGCAPDQNVCDNCCSSTACSPPCFWTLDDPSKPAGTGVCTLGANVCAEGLDAQTGYTSGLRSCGPSAAASAKQRPPAPAKLLAAPRQFAPMMAGAAPGLCPMAGTSGRPRPRRVAKSSKEEEMEEEMEEPLTEKEVNQEGNAAYLGDINASLAYMHCVRLPTAFSNQETGVDPSKSQVFGCLPNVFIPTVGATVFDNEVSNNATSPDPDPANRLGYDADPVRTNCRQQFDKDSKIPPKPILKATCYSASDVTDPANPPLPVMQNFSCGCPCTGVDEDACTYGANADVLPTPDKDYVCWVAPAQVSGTEYAGGYMLRQASQFGGTVNTTTASRGIYNTGNLPIDPMLFQFAAQPSSNLITWEQVNLGGLQQQRLFMFLRMYYWIMLTHATSSRGMTELGFSTFINDGGWDTHTQQPTVPLFMADGKTVNITDLSETTYYSTQPLLLYDDKGNPLFYTMQELVEGAYVVNPDKTAVSTTLKPVVGAAGYLKQLSMWTFDPDNDGLSGNVARNGMTMATMASGAEDPSGQIQEGQKLQGLLQGTYGFCDLWFTNDAFVGGTLGSAAGMLALMGLYIGLHIYFERRK